MLADHAGGHAEPNRGAGEPAAFHHLGEDPHVVEAVHKTILKQSRIVDPVPPYYQATRTSHICGQAAAYKPQNAEPANH